MQPNGAALSIQKSKNQIWGKNASCYNSSGEQPYKQGPGVREITNSPVTARLPLVVDGVVPIYALYYNIQEYVGQSWEVNCPEYQINGQQLFFH